MKASRNITTVINWILDNLCPPILRDCYPLMFPIYYAAYGKSAAKLLKYKDHYPTLSEEEYAAYAGGYMNIREFVFKTNLSGEQKDALQSYLEIFRKVIRKQHETCYLEMAEEFLGWTEMML